MAYPWETSLIQYLGQLTTDQAVWIYCQNMECRHKGKLDTVALVLRYGAMAKLDALKRALYCPKCREANDPKRPDKNLQWSCGGGHPGNKDYKLIGHIYEEEIARREMVGPRPSGCDVDWVSRPGRRSGYPKRRRSPTGG